MPSKKMKTFDSFDDWARDQTRAHQRLIARMRTLVSSAAPRLIETVKWGNGCWVKGDLPILFLHAEPDHLQFGFFAGAKLNDPKKLLRGSGKFVRHIRIEASRDIDAAVFSTLVRGAVRAPAYK